MRTYLTSLLAVLALVACGGGNDVASSGATALSAAASTSSTATAPTTEPKLNGQIDERTGVAPSLAMGDSATGIDSQIKFAMDEIRYHLAVFPKAADTVEGIHNFWIRWEVKPEIAVTTDALSLLKAEGLVEMIENVNERSGKRSWIWRIPIHNMAPGEG